MIRHLDEDDRSAFIEGSQRRPSRTADFRSRRGADLLAAGGPLLRSAGPCARAGLPTPACVALDEIGELTSLRWRAVDLARGRLTVEESKTDG
jgi:hypothetical protein